MPNMQHWSQIAVGGRQLTRIPDGTARGADQASLSKIEYVPREVVTDLPRGVCMKIAAISPILR